MIKQWFCSHTWNKIGMERTSVNPSNGGLIKTVIYRCYKCGKEKEVVVGGYVP